jgi:hypothetical protein
MRQSQSATPRLPTSRKLYSPYIVQPNRASRYRKQISLLPQLAFQIMSKENGSNQVLWSSTSESTTSLVCRFTP